MASPGLRQIQDFVSAIYSPYATDELLNRYDTYYDDYESRPSKQFNNQYRSVRYTIIHFNYITMSL